MAKKGIEIWPGHDRTGTWTLNIRKKKGKLSLDEIRQAAMDYDQDFYMLAVKAMDEEIGQFYDTDDLDGDCVVLYRADAFFSWRDK